MIIPKYSHQDSSYYRERQEFIPLLIVLNWKLIIPRACHSQKRGDLRINKKTFHLPHSTTIKILANHMARRESYEQTISRIQKLVSNGQARPIATATAMENGRDNLSNKEEPISIDAQIENETLSVSVNTFGQLHQSELSNRLGAPEKSFYTHRTRSTTNLKPSETKYIGLYREAPEGYFNLQALNSEITFVNFESPTA